MRIFKKVLKWSGIALVPLAVAGFLFSQIGQAMNRRHLAPPSREMVTIEGRQVHVMCSGQGTRVFVLESGLGGWSVYWWRIQPELAKNARVCSFDREGMGWSDRHPGAAHDGVAAAEELRMIVNAAGIPRPFYYVGHSLGANFAQIYYSRYPNDIAGLILLEPGRPQDLLEDFHGTQQEAMKTSECTATCMAATVAGELGVTRLVAMSAPGKSFDGEWKAQYRAGLARPSYAEAMARFYAALPKIAYQNVAVGSFGDTPVLAFASTNPRGPEGKETEADVARWIGEYRAYLASIVAKSSHGMGPVLVPESTHVSMTLGKLQAAFVVKAIEEFVSRNQEPEAAKRATK
ncbi:MAG TPA: alpha/beta fold hydrolase [Terriglobales bacterium]|nr:alpha/beta fold hydrolase [Terriglobales bacterium]